jgi:hypothetical protein
MSVPSSRIMEPVRLFALAKLVLLPSLDLPVSM